jgi:hypothetical protein
VDGGSQRVLEIRSTIRILLKIRVLNQTTGVLIGKLDGINDPASWVTMFDLRNGHIITDAPAYFPSISPDSRYLVFVRFFPEHFVDEATSSNVVAYYDLKKPIPMADLQSNHLVGSVAYPVPPDGLYHAVQYEFEWHSSDDFTFEDLVRGVTYYDVNVSLSGQSSKVTKMKANGPLR